MTDDYTPDEKKVRSMYKAGSTIRRETPEQHYLGASTPDYLAEFDRFIRKAERDAAREALDGLADSWEARRRVAGAHSARIYRDAHYPETED